MPTEKSMKHIFPALADLTQDIAGPIPVDLIKSWIESDQSDASHERILEPYKRRGTMVSSDASGLSKLSAGRPLIDVMKLVSEPKEIIYAHGKAIGGEAVGIWAADNTQMFYDEAIDVNDVVSQMIAAQKAIEGVEVSVGIGMHQGVAYEIGGGLYGADADEIEEFTEEESNANEVIVSPAVKSSLREEFLAGDGRGDMHIVDYSAVSVDAPSSDDVFYPAPFDRDFHEALLKMEIGSDIDPDLQKIFDDRLKETSIVLFRVFHENKPRMLDRFIDQVAANTTIHNVCRRYDAQLVKSNGALAIISCEKPGEGVDLAIALMEAAKEVGLSANVSVSRGEVFIFDLGEKGFDLAGGPVNITSKLAEDTDERGKMFFEGEEMQHCAQHGFTDAFEIEKSGVTIKGIRV